jgi:hypothetical protein
MGQDPNVTVLKRNQQHNRGENVEKQWREHTAPLRNVGDIKGCRHFTTVNDLASHTSCKDSTIRTNFSGQPIFPRICHELDLMTE